MKNILLVIQTLSAVFIIMAVLVQSKGTGLNKGWGGGNLKSFTRRGLEKIIFRSTFAFLAIFIISSFLQLVI